MNATTGAPDGEAGSVPVVDLNALVRDLYAAAERARERRALLLTLIASAERDASYLESAADTLAGLERRVGRGSTLDA